MGIERRTRRRPGRGSAALLDAGAVLLEVRGDERAHARRHARYVLSDVRALGRRLKH